MTTSASTRIAEWGRSILQIACVVAAIAVAKIAVAEPYYVPSASMEPTLLIGDELLATKFSYGYSAASLPASIVLPPTQRILGALPERGDVVVFRWPGDRSQIWVKRVIGLPGDRIAMRRGTPWINGKPVELRADGTGEMETENGALIAAARYIETLPGGRSHPILKLSREGMLDNMPEVVVPPDHVFVMGDNRDNSSDSRLSVERGGVGMLPTNNLVGRVNVLVGSWDLGMRHQPVWTWPSGLRLSRFFTAVH
jgi:signal peptidase I